MAVIGLGQWGPNLARALDRFVSVLLQLGGEDPIDAHAFGADYILPGIEDVVFCFLRFPSRLVAYLHLSWLDPHKERRFTVVGSKRVATAG
jgi:hypothetical protein